MTFALILLAVMSLLLFLWGLLGRERMLTLPTVTAYLYLAFFIPQAIYLSRTPFDGAFGTSFLLFYMAACLAGLTIGFEFTRAKVAPKVRKERPPQPSETRYMAGAIVLALIGLGANLRLAAFDTADLGSQWTGAATAWYLLAQTTFFALALSGLRFLKTKNMIYLAIAGFTLIAAVLGFSTNVKRHMIAEVAIILGAAFFFIYRLQPPRVAVLAVCFLGMVLLHQVGTVRVYVQREEGSIAGAFIDGTAFERFSYFSSERAPELSVAALDVKYAREQGVIEGPAELWNTMVHQYVPAFVFGRDFKNALMVEVEGAALEAEYAKFATVGITRTGFSDSYRSFGIFGVVLFVLLGAAFGWLWTYALHGRVWAQFYYIVFLNDALIAHTQSMSRFIATLPFVLLMTLPFLYRSARKKRRAARHNGSIGTREGTPSRAPGSDLATGLNRGG